MGDLVRSTPRGDATDVQLTGDWCIANIKAIEHALDDLRGLPRTRLAVSYAGIERMDLSGAWLLRQALVAMRNQGVAIDARDQEPHHFEFIEEFAGADDSAGERSSEASRGRSIADGIAWVGRGLVERGLGGRESLGYFGRLVATFAAAIVKPRRLRLPSIVRHVYETGIQAIPIVALIALLISVIVAYLGSQQLANFGAEIFTVDLVAIAVLREMGVLLTAIIVAGRSGSAFAAEIGVMELNDEVDALKATGFDPFEVLVLPRVLGLVIALPLLTIIADAMGLIGGALLSIFLLDISLEQFLVRLQDALAPTTFWAGLVKAPVFAAIIALVGTMRGMQVRDSSRELGRLTTVAVVQAIFLVILADALFAILFQEIGF
ncbi:MAG TPA: ABC transporter permease [Steroidobacteraceae bacterium]|nr:ABC transporter permease [Steroidobacteraceae bacterium]